MRILGETVFTKQQKKKRRKKKKKKKKREIEYGQDGRGQKTHIHRWLTSGGLASLEVGVIAGKQLPDQVIQRGIEGTKLLPGVDLVVVAVTSLSSLRVDVEIALQALRLK